ncbi:hypothetical protein INT44_006084 [Umbelopsis vinacea]|uniref:Uncharacterized protein n=1 Tax=Umbelopsis vinacea TaxID=44442 RepID=A0A8H7Q0G3_9FUNG|nr:hypothetical protein INT44_006084 [Umbelopsis vinacea]
MASHPFRSSNMKFSILSALLAFSAATASAESFGGAVYIYQNNVSHPKTSYVNVTKSNVVVTDGVACSGDQTLPAKDGALSATFTTIDNPWGYNSEKQKDILMGYISTEGNKCLTLIRGNPLKFAACPSFNTPIKTGNRFAWFHDKRSGAIWAYGGDAKGAEARGISFLATTLQTTGKNVVGTTMHKDPVQDVYLGLGRVNFGDSAQSPAGCA